MELGKTKLLTISEFAVQVGMSYRTAWRLVKAGDLPSLLAGRRRLLDSRWVDQWLAGAGYQAHSDARERKE
jgi:excisionase family DNA binding protein